MDTLSHRVRAGATSSALTRAKAETLRKVAASPLIRGCAGESAYPRALCGGFWYFVNQFPEIIRETYTTLPAGLANTATQRLMKRLAPALAGTLGGMESDERTHRALWIRAASRVGISEPQLQQWRVLAEVRSLTDSIKDEQQLRRRLLYFVAVEMVAEGVSRCLVAEPRFVEMMGAEGMLWFAAHLVAPDDTTTHEALAYDLAVSVKSAKAGPLDETSIYEDIQRCVDWFYAASLACVREFTTADDSS